MFLNFRGDPHEGGQPTQVAPVCKGEEPRPIGLYVHIPFCSYKCPFCDFYTYPAHDTARMERYVNALCLEIEGSERLGFKKASPVSSLYFGGGTPSLLSTQLLSKLLDVIQNHFRLAKNAEVSLEINPETVTPQKAQEWRKVGINRASLGVESFDEEELLRLARDYTPKVAIRSYQYLREAHFENVSFDLMFGLERQTVPRWLHTLSQAVQLEPDHISAYNLTIEEKTRYANEQKKKTLLVPEEDEQVELFLTTRSYLSENGYPPYETSNFSKPGFESQHNLNYWVGGNYWGVGASAHSFRRHSNSISRWWNIRHVKKYTESQLNNLPATEEREELSLDLHWAERLMTGLRLSQGVDLSQLNLDLATPTPTHIQTTLEKFLKEGLLVAKNSSIQLSTQGLLLSNELFRAFLP